MSCADRCSHLNSLNVLRPFSFPYLCLSFQADSQHLHLTSSHISLPTNPPFPPQHPHPSSFQQHSTSSCALKWASCYGNPIQQHIILLSELKRGSISDDVTVSSGALKSWSRSHQNWACVYIHTYIQSYIHTCVACLKKEENDKKKKFSLQPGVEDEVRLEVSESPLHTVWEG